MAQKTKPSGGAIRSTLSFDFIFQFASFFISVLFVHTIYLLFIRPEAALQVSTAAGVNLPAPRTFVMIMKDYEQETCLILMFWALSIIFLKAYHIIEQRYLFDIDLISRTNTEPISDQEAHQIIDRINADPERSKNSVLIQSLSAGLRRFAATRNVQYASDAVGALAESMGARMDAELSMIRYIIWAIPSIGFIGTVRGIGEALSQAYLALQGDIAGMTDSLGVAFNSTFVALVISIVLMFLVHQLQLMQDQLVLDTQDYCDRVLLGQLTE